VVVPSGHGKRVRVKGEKKKGRVSAGSDKSKGVVSAFQNQGFGKQRTQGFGSKGGEPDGIDWSHERAKVSGLTVHRSARGVRITVRQWTEGAKATGGRSPHQGRGR